VSYVYVSREHTFSALLTPFVFRSQSAGVKVRDSATSLRTVDSIRQNPLRLVRAQHNLLNQFRVSQPQNRVELRHREFAEDRRSLSQNEYPFHCPRRKRTGTINTEWVGVWFSGYEGRGIRRSTGQCSIRMSIWTGRVVWARFAIHPSTAIAGFSRQRVDSGFPRASAVMCQGNVQVPREESCHHCRAYVRSACSLCMESRYPGTAFAGIALLK
jgi:hypothetical protein